MRRAWTSCAVAVVAILAPGATAQALPPRQAQAPHVYTRHQRVTLDQAQTGTYTLACRDSDVVSDGTWRVDAVHSRPQPGTVAYDLVSGLDVLAAEPFSASAYRFTVRNNSNGEARVRFDITCLDRTHNVPLHVRRQSSRSATMSVGTGGPAMVRCRPGTTAIAPGFQILDGLARQLRRYPDRGRLARMDRTFAVLQSHTQILGSGRCLRAGHLRLRLRSRAVRLPAGRRRDVRVSCHRSEAPMLGVFRLGGTWYLGQRPRGRARVFRLQAGPAGTGTGRVGVVCLRR